MRLFRRRRKAAIFLSLFALSLLLFVNRQVALLSEDVMTGSDVTSPKKLLKGADLSVVMMPLTFQDLVRTTPGTKYFANMREKNQDSQSHVNIENRIEKQNIRDIIALGAKSKPDEDDEEYYEDDGQQEATFDNKTKNNATEMFKKTHTMTIQGGGRLGNAMFQLASLIGVSSYHGYQATIAAGHYLRRIFKISLPGASPDRFKLKSKREKSPGIFDPSLFELSHNVNWSMVGYYQSWKYFANVSDEVRQHFRFKDEVILDMVKSVPMIANWTRVKIGVHVRRGDMASKYERERGYNVADVGFLNRSMNYFRKNYDNPVFIVCSDSLTWCKDNIAARDTVFVKNRREVDLATLAHCDHNIVTSGSFGWWGAWLAGGEVVYFKNFPRNRTWLDRLYHKEDYYPPDWIPMA